MEVRLPGAAIYSNLEESLDRTVERLRPERSLFIALDGPAQEGSFAVVGQRHLIVEYLLSLHGRHHVVPKTRLELRRGLV